MTKITECKKNLANPDEVRTFPKGKLELVNLKDVVVGRATFEPGWKWSECLKPIAGTKSCEASHTGYVLSGHMHVETDDGMVIEYGPGDAMVLSPGHDAWTVGNENCVVLDFTGMEKYAKPKN